MCRSISARTSGLKRLLITCLPCVGEFVCDSVCVCMRVCVLARTCVCHSTDYSYLVHYYRQFDLRFTVIHDRFDHDKHKVCPYITGTVA